MTAIILRDDKPKGLDIISMYVDEVQKTISLVRVFWSKCFSILQIVGLLAVAPALTIGCNNIPSTTPQPEINLLVQKEPTEYYLLALLPGILTVDEKGYLRVTDTLVLWPYGYSLKTEDEDTWVIDENGQLVVGVGDRVDIGGGYIPEWTVLDKLGQALPADCEGPYWLAGGSIK